MPEDETVVETASPPFDQLFPDEAEEVSVTLPPLQKAVGPFAVITGVLGLAFTTTAIGAEIGEAQPFPLMYETV